MLLTTKMTETHIKAIVTYKIFSVFPVAAFRASLTSISYPLNYSTYSSTAPVYYFNWSVIPEPLKIPVASEATS